MKKQILAIALLSSSIASANVISVEFAGCAQDQDTICALVYNDQTTGENYQGQEMVVEQIQDGTLLRQINGLIGTHGRSLALNIEGKVLRINKMGGGSKVRLQVNSLTNSGSRPRGL